MMFEWPLLSVLVRHGCRLSLRPTLIDRRVETTLRQVVGGRVLQSVISDREGLAHEVAEIVCYSLSCRQG